ncbi:hypothetical protein U9M48_029613 [Paspalum notatum var. saurae]|uniref:F-box domain-containing protein n=1 Tax=Paspalum notatum var. saurae TaxID=547442 RepID=A0AAQ3X2V9_PASNO
MHDDSTAEDDPRRAKRARLTLSSEDVDLISGLDEDLLLRVLGLLTDARDADAVRTGPLSRRWLGFWTRVPALRFTSPPESKEASRAEKCAALESYFSFVNDVLARHSTQSDCAIESLHISCAHSIT